MRVTAPETTDTAIVESLSTTVRGRSWVTREDGKGCFSSGQQEEGGTRDRRQQGIAHGFDIRTYLLWMTFIHTRHGRGTRMEEVESRGSMVENGECRRAL